MDTNSHSHEAHVRATGEEQRRHTRVVPKLPVTVQVAGLPLRRGILHDVSYTGLFVHVDTLGIVEGECDVEILLDGEGRSIAIHGEIIRVTVDGLAIRKESVQRTEGFRDLVNLIAYNSPDVARVEREIHQ